MDGDKHFLCTFLSAREHAFLNKMSDGIHYISIVFFKSMTAPSKAEPATITLLSLHIREKVPLVSHSSSPFCICLVTLIDQRNFVSAHPSKGLLKKKKKYNWPLQPRREARTHTTECKSDPFIRAHEVSHSHWGTWNAT